MAQLLKGLAQRTPELTQNPEEVVCTCSPVMVTWGAELGGSLTLPHGVLAE